MRPMVIAEQKGQRNGSREFGRAAETAQPGVERAAQSEKTRFRDTLIQDAAGGLHADHLFQLLEHFPPSGLDALPLSRPGISEVFKNGLKARTPIAIVGREVSASEKRF